MNGSRFYCPVPLTQGQRVELPENAARHASKVLRLRVGEEMILFNGSGGEYLARLASIERHRVTADVLDWRARECEAPLAITLIQALQAGEKMDTTIQKAVELGVSCIVPVATQRSVVRLEGDRALRRLAHWQGVIVSACEQCGRNRLPEVKLLLGLRDWLEQPAADDALRLMLVPGGPQTLTDFSPPRPGLRIELLIGAEGGLAPDEISLAQAVGFAAIRLGPRILRTETAGLAAIAAIQCLWGDFTKE